MASRRDFFTALKKSEEKDIKLVRPPYGLDESTFLKECVTCADKACVSSCEQNIIYILDDGTPTLDFTKVGCTFCEDCANACEPNVLSLENLVTSEVINAKFIIKPDACVAHNGVICFSCKEPCIDNAILFNGMFNPVIDMDKCTGCGYCVGKCITYAIEFNATDINQVAVQ
jgi:ferredoxin-type protein NapF